MPAVCMLMATLSSAVGGARIEGGGGPAGGGITSRLEEPGGARVPGGADKRKEHEIEKGKKREKEGMKQRRKSECKSE